MDLSIESFREASKKREYGYYSNGRYYVNRRESDSPDGHSIVYVDVKGETFWQNFGNRTSRPHTEWRPLVLKALRDAGVEFTNIRWSTKAGCGMCACSPGFIVQGHKGKDWWLTITADEEQTVDPAQAADRQAQLAAQL